MIGYVVYYQGERDGGAYITNAPGWSSRFETTVYAMMQNRPEATLCIEPVTEIPEWVED